MMIEPNERIIKALDWYINMNQSPHYAIMLNGEWGCGKTHFVREQWLAQITNPDKYSIVSVSLFGISRTEELQNSLVHNRLKITQNEKGKNAISKDSILRDGTFVNKTWKTTKNIVSGLGENFLGLRMDDLGPMFARDWLNDDSKEGKTKILILDDLERSNMELKEVFGFISSYLESTDLRVVFISNDAKIGGQNYKETREKIIGETFKIEADIDGAIESFFKEMEWTEHEKCYLKPLIKETQSKLKINNLRTTRQTLLKLESLMEIVEREESYKDYSYEEIEIHQEKYKKQYYLEKISHLFMIVNMQKLQGVLEREEIGLCLSAYLKYNMGIQSYKEKYKEEQKSKGEQERSYTRDIDLGVYDTYLPLMRVHKNKKFTIWEEYIWDGYMKESEISSVVEQDMEILIPSNEKEKETLLKLVMGYWDYDKEEFYRLQSVLIKELKEGKYIDINDLVVSYNLLKLFSEEGILDKKEDIDELFSKVIEEIKTKCPSENQRTYETILGGRDGLDRLSYKGYQVQIADERGLVSGFLDEVNDIYKKMTNDELEKDINDIANRILKGDSEVDTLFIELYPRPYYMRERERQRFIRVPALNWLGIEKVWDMLKQISLIEQLKFFTILRDRYSLTLSGYGGDSLVFEPELEIVKELKNKYEQKYEEAKQDGDNKVIVYGKISLEAEKIYKEFKTSLNKGRYRSNTEIES